MKFKEWTIPGPLAPGGIEAELGETLDAISGHFKIFQYREGHRFSTDDLLVAWYGSVGCPSAGHVLDLGSGIGSVATVAAWRLRGAQFVTIEAQEKSVRLARKSMTFNGLEARVDVRIGDLRDSGSYRMDEKFDLVLGSPPYFPLGTGGLSPDGEHRDQKTACRFETRGSIHDYAAAAALRLAPGGVFASVFPKDQEARVFEGARVAGLQIVKTRDIIFKEGEPPLVRVDLMMRSEDLPPRFRGITVSESPLVIRLRDGTVSPEYSTVKLSLGFPP